jgi:hypothetical protein
VLCVQRANNVTGEYFQGMTVRNAQAVNKLRWHFQILNKLFVQTARIVFSNTTQIATHAITVLNATAETLVKILQDSKVILYFRVDPV